MNRLCLRSVGPSTRKKRLKNSPIITIHVWVHRSQRTARDKKLFFNLVKTESWAGGNELSSGTPWEQMMLSRSIPPFIPHDKCKSCCHILSSEDWEQFPGSFCLHDCMICYHLWVFMSILGSGLRGGWSVLKEKIHLGPVWLTDTPVKNTQKNISDKNREHFFDFYLFRV